MKTSILTIAAIAALLTLSVVAPNITQVIGNLILGLVGALCLGMVVENARLNVRDKHAQKKDKPSA